MFWNFHNTAAMQLFKNTTSIIVTINKLGITTSVPTQLNNKCYQHDQKLDKVFT